MKLTYEQIREWPESDLLHNALMIVDHLQHTDRLSIYDDKTRHEGCMKAIEVDGSHPPPSLNGPSLQINIDTRDGITQLEAIANEAV